CVPARAVGVTVELGPVKSAPFPLDVQGGGGGTLGLGVGEATTLGTQSAFACVRLPAGPSSARYLVIAQNAHDVADQTLPFQLVALTGPVTAPPLELASARGVAFADDGPGELAARWEAGLRARERALPPSSALPSIDELRPLAQARIPAVGDRQEFRVINKDNEFE